MKKFQYLLMIFIPFFFTACGGGGGSSTTSTETYSGYFVDSPVVGLNVKCSSENITRVTDIQGSFQCKAGDKVSFYIGDLSIGNSIILDKDGKIISPYDLFENDTNKAVKLAQLLQTIDIDNDPTNSIEIDKNMVTALNSGFDNTISFDDEDSTYMAIETIIGKSLVDYYQAKQHLDETLYEIENPNSGTDPVDDNITVPGDDNVTIPGDNNVTVPGDDNVTVPGDDNVTVPGDDNVTVPGDDNVTVPGDDNTTSLPFPPQPPTI